MLCLLRLCLYVAHFLVKSEGYRYLQESSLTYGYNGHNTLHKYIGSIKDMPYHVLIAYNNLYCSGSLIRSKVIVTVASCFVRWTDQRIVVKVGAETVTGIGQVIEVLEVRKHEYFKHNSQLDNDIALLMLKDHVVFTRNVQKVIMIDSEMAMRRGITIDVSGWGSANLQPSRYAGVLLWSEMSLIDKARCNRIYPHLSTRSNFCARYAPERRLSDNGGGAVVKDLLVGILSYGASKTAEPYVAILTNVSYFHRWISLNTRRFLKKYCVPPIEYEIDSSYQNIEEWR